MMEQNLEYEKNNFNETVAKIYKEKLNKCNQCDFASYHASALKTHLKRHKGEKSNKCSHCAYACFDPSALRIHFKIHSGEKSNKCNQCDFASSQAGHLKTHLKIHIGEKSNKCNQCDYASSQAGHLKTHWRKVKQTGNLKIHMKRHNRNLFLIDTFYFCNKSNNNKKTGKSLGEYYKICFYFEFCVLALGTS